MTRNFNDVWINYVIINWPKESYFEIVTPIQTMIPATSRSGRYELSWFIQMCGMYVYIYIHIWFILVYIGLYMSSTFSSASCLKGSFVASQNASGFTRTTLRICDKKPVLVITRASLPSTVEAKPFVEPPFLSMSFMLLWLVVSAPLWGYYSQWMEK